MSRHTTAILVGGSGFVGIHLLRHLIAEKAYRRILVLDLNSPSVENETVRYHHVDIRKPIDPKPILNDLDGPVTIYNIAAICRIPGFPDHDYFRTNMTGAETVTRLAEEIGCTNIVFTSSISVYGVSEVPKDEGTLPMPNNPYGISKLVAEKTHLSWFERGPDRRLQILRPGIVFGLGEAANFTRLYRAVSGGYFFFPGRLDTRKASVYVKDAARAHLHFAEKAPEQFNLFNLCYPDPPTIEETVNTIARVVRKQKPKIVLPSWILLTAAWMLQIIPGFQSGHFRFHPDRVRKLMVSTNVSGHALQRYGFSFIYSLEDAIRDWYKDSGGRGLL